MRCADRVPTVGGTCAEVLSRVQRTSCSVWAGGMARGRKCARVRGGEAVHGPEFVAALAVQGAGEVHGEGRAAAHTALDSGTSGETAFGQGGKRWA